MDKLKENMQETVYGDVTLYIKQSELASLIQLEHNKIIDLVLPVLEECREVDCIRCEDKWANDEIIELIAKLRQMKGDDKWKETGE